MKLALPVFVLVVLSISIFATNYCSSLEQYQQKSEFYQGLSGSQEKLAVYGMTAEQVVQVLKSIDSSIEMMKQLCEKEKASASSAVQAREAAAIVTAATAATTQGTAVIGTAAGGQGSTATGTQGIGGRVNITEGTVTANIVGVGSPIANATNTRIIADGNVVNTHAVAIIPSTQIVVRPVNSSEGIIPVPLPPPEIAVPSLPPATGSSLARFAYWWGKVTMVQTTSGSWAPASNLRDGANINPLTYCQQLNSRSLGVREVGKQSISGWINRDGIADSQGRTSYTDAGVVYECLDYKYWDVHTQLNPSVPVFAEPSDAGSTQTVQATAIGTAGSTQAASASAGGTHTAIAPTSAASAGSIQAEVTSEQIIAPVGTTAAGDVSDYYKQKMQVILQKNGNVDAQIASLKQLSSEINSLIANLLEKKSLVAMNSEGMKGLVDKVDVTPTTVRSGSVSVASAGKIIETNMAATKPVEVEAKGGSVVLRDNGVEAKAVGISVTSNTVSVGGSDVNVAPSEIAKKVNAVSKKISISTAANSKAVYTVDAQTNAKILGILPVTMEHTVEINAQDGSTISDSKPWWSAVAVEDSTQPPTIIPTSAQTTKVQATDAQTATAQAAS